MKHFKPLLSFWSRFIVSPPRFRPVFLTLLILIVLFANTLVFVRGVSAEKGYFPLKAFSTLLNGFDKEKDPDNPQIAGLALSSNIKPKSAPAKQLLESNQSSDVVLGDSIQKIAPGSSSSNITLQNVTTNGASTSQNLSLLGKVYFGSGIEVKGSAKFQKSADVEGNLTVGTEALHVDATNDQVGIGTVHPQHKLDVAGNVKVGQELIVYQETTLKDKLQVQGATDVTGILNANGGIEIDGDKLIIDGKRGDVETEGTMRVHDQAWLNSNVSLGNDSSDTLETNARVGSSFIPKATNTYDLGASSLYWNNIYTQNLFTSGTITASGNILPGATDSYDLGSSSSYWNNLYAKNIYSSGTTTSTGNIIPGADNTYSLGSSLYRWKDLYLGPASLKIYNSIGANAEYATLGFSSNVATLDIKKDGSGTYRPFAINQNGSEAMRITGGNVGIGTTSPLYKLDVNGDGRIQGGELYLSGVDSSPSTTEGTLYYDTDDDQLKVYANGKWQADRSTATFIIAASDSRNKEKADYVCDGTDDQVEIKAAIDALPDTGGRVVLLEGTFYINSEILISDLANNNNVVLEGQEMGTILTVPTGHASTMNMINVYGSSVAVTGVTIKNLRIDGNKTNVTGGYYNGIKFNNVATSTIDNVYLSNGKGDGAGNGYGYWIINSTNVTIRNCTGKTWDFEPMEIRGSSKILVTECWLEFRVELYDTCDNIKFSNNYFYNFTVYAGTNTGGSNYADYIDISNNYFYTDNLAYSNVWLVRTNYASVNNNYFYNTQARTCIYGQVANYALVAGNMIKIIAADATGIGGAFAYSSIMNNFIDEGGTNYNGGINLYTGATYSTLKNNTITRSASGGQGIQIDSGATYNELDGNYTRNIYYGVKNAGNNNIIMNNRFVASDVPISGAGTGAIIKRNIGYTTENSGTATIASGSTYVDVTHGLATTPSINNINVTQTNNLGSATKFWISDVGATTFRINVDIDPGATTATFSWQIGSY